MSATDRRMQPIRIRNPMSVDQSVMRTSLVPNLLAAVARNQSHGRPDVALFEVGSVFLRRGEGVSERDLHELADEPTWATCVLAGKKPSWVSAGASYDVFDAKGLAMIAIHAVAGDVRVRVRSVENVGYFHPGVTGELVVGHDVVGWFGEYHPNVRKKLGVDGPAFGFDLDLTKLPLAPPAQMQAIPKYPGTSRDVSLLLAESIPAARIAEVIEQTNEALVTGAWLAEDYRDAKLGEHMKSQLWRISYRSADRTLTDAEVDKAHENIVARLVENLPAQRR